MYYSIPPMKGVERSGWNIGIAESHDLVTWEKVGEIVPDADAEYEKNGLCAPGALVRDGKVHLFTRRMVMGVMMPYAMPFQKMGFTSSETQPTRFLDRWGVGIADGRSMPRCANSTGAITSTYATVIPITRYRCWALLLRLLTRTLAARIGRNR